ncbi:ROK family protein [Scrofimicrobium canadense]|nr:ROK family protein [Scrofimicrobium canadense]
MDGMLSIPDQKRDSEPPSHPASLDAVLHYAWDASEFTATDVMAATALTRTTAIEAMQTLIDLGLLRELPNAREAGEYRKGRPARRFEFCADAGVVVGVDAGHTHLTAVAADLRGDTLAVATTDSGLLPGSEGDAPKAHEHPRNLMVTEVIERAVAGVGRDHPQVFAVCVGVPAPVDVHGRSPAQASGFWQRVNPNLTTALESLAPIVLVENDASLAALAEGAVGEAQECRNFVTILAGSRLGSGVVVDGNLLRGARGAVGELGALEYVEGVDDTSGLGRHATALARQALEEGTVAADSALRKPSPEDLSGRIVLESAKEGDPDALRIVDQVAARLARIVTMVAGAYDPERVVIAGAISPSVTPIIEAARRALPTDPYSQPPDIVASKLGDRAVVTGAVQAAARLARAQALELRLAARR